MKRLWYVFLSKILTKRRRAYARNIAKMIRLTRRSENEVSADSRDWKRLEVNIVGSGNRVRIGRLRAGKGVVAVNIFGSNCRVEIEPGFTTSYRTLLAFGIDHCNFGPVEKSEVHIGADVSIESGIIQICNSHAVVRIGRGCMMANEINIFHTDAHPIYALGGDKPINRVGELSIGDHCWIGARAVILKNSRVPDDCIVGWGSVVSKRFDEAHCVLAGNPATIVKRGITWKQGDPRYTANA